MSKKSNVKINNKSKKSKINEQIQILTKENKKYQTKIKILLTLIILLTIILIFFIYYFNKESQKKCIKKIQDKNIVFVGDSLTYMYNLEKYYKGYKVVNSGVDGDFTWGVLNDLENRVYKYNPSKVILLIGTNDIYKEKTAADIANNVEKIIKNIKKNRPYCEIYLVSLYPVNRTDNDKINLNMVKNRTNKFIKVVNKKYKAISQKYKINYINIFDKLIDNDGNLDIKYTREGLHLVDKGYEKVTKEIKKVL